MESMGYFDRVNDDIFRFVPTDSTCILEIGCGAGALAAEFAKLNPRCEWHGVEPNADACRQARERMTSAEPIAVEAWLRSQTWRLARESIGPQFDAIIAGDVLEHLEDPWSVVKELVEHLKPHGQFIASIPNSQHWIVLSMLMCGEWPRQSEGLFDRTHKHLFTLKTATEMLVDAGLHVFDVVPRDWGEEGIEDFLIDINGFLRRLGKERSADIIKQMRSAQYVFRCIKLPSNGERFIPGHIKPLTGLTRFDANLGMPVDAPRPVAIMAITAEGCCARPRIIEPMRMIQTIPGTRCGIETWHIARNYDPETLPRGSIIIQQRHRAIDVSWQRRALDHGCLLIAEIDDHPAFLEGMADRDFAPLRMVHAVQCSTEPIADFARRINPYIAVFPNQIAELPPPREYGDGPVRIFYGAQNRRKDWEPIMPTLNRVLRDFASVEFQVIHDQEFFDALQPDGPDDFVKVFTPFCEYDQYRKILRSCDIALLPLESNAFNRSKSDIKFLECAAEGVTCLMSELAADQIRPHANDAYRCYCNKIHFDIVLRDLIKNASGRWQTAEIAYTYIRDHRMLADHFRKRYDWYVSLLDRRDELTRDLFERTSEMR